MAIIFLNNSSFFTATVQPETQQVHCRLFDIGTCSHGLLTTSLLHVFNRLRLQVHNAQFLFAPFLFSKRSQRGADWRECTWVSPWLRAVTYRFSTVQYFYFNGIFTLVYFSNIFLLLQQNFQATFFRLLIDHEYFTIMSLKTKPKFLSVSRFLDSCTTKTTENSFTSKYF